MLTRSLLPGAGHYRNCSAEDPAVGSAVADQACAVVGIVVIPEIECELPDGPGQADVPVTVLDVEDSTGTKSAGIESDFEIQHRGQCNPGAILMSVPINRKIIRAARGSQEVLVFERKIDRGLSVVVADDEIRI